jgi:hypothetical protein
MYGRVDVQLQRSWPRHQVEVSSQLQSAVAVPQGKEPPVSILWKAGRAPRPVKKKRKDLAPPGNQSQVFKPVYQCYIDWFLFLISSYITFKYFKTSWFIWTQGKLFRWGVLWDVTPCSVLDRYRRFEGSCDVYTLSYIYIYIMGLERCPLSLVSTIKELLERICICSDLENRECCRRDPSRWPRDTLYPQKLALTRSLGRCSSLAKFSLA